MVIVMFFIIGTGRIKYAETILANESTLAGTKWETVIDSWRI